METTPCLIQRAKFSNNANQKGIDSLLDFDYMGSAEFEWGALPKSLARVRENKQGGYIQFEIVLKDFENKPITILCKLSDAEEVPKMINKIAKGELRLKERCDLDDYLKAVESYRVSDFWWDIKNDFFFWRSDNVFNEKFVKALFSI